MIVVTKHAIQRGKERLSFNQATLERMAIKAFETGIKHSDTKGALKKYVRLPLLETKNSQ